MRSNPFAAGAVVASLAASLLSSSPGTTHAATPEALAPPAISAPAGTYQLDPNHSSITFRVSHLGLSNYVARFTRYQATLELDPRNLSASSVAAKIDPTSIHAEFSGDYHAAVKNTLFRSWSEELAQSPKFFNAGQFPAIQFRSTRVEQSGGGAVRIVGDLLLLGQTHPITLNATLVGSSEKHPFGGGGAIGFSATGSFNRSIFGMNHLLQPPMIGDTVTVQFEGEFRQASPPAATPGS
jgi:polyisoprenoid-binding protein YceI